MERGRESTCSSWPIHRSFSKVTNRSTANEKKWKKYSREKRECVGRQGLAFQANTIACTEITKQLMYSRTPKGSV